MEPPGIIDMRSYLQEYSHRFDYILCFDTSLYGNQSKCIEYVPTSCWIDSSVYNMIDTSLKQFKISCLTGHKAYADGHKKRQSLYNQQLTFLQKAIDIIFYRSRVEPHLPNINNNPFISSTSLSSKADLFTNYQFSIVIENSRETNYITANCFCKNFATTLRQS